MARGNGSLIGQTQRYPASGLWSLQEARLRAAINIDYAIIGGGASGGNGGYTLFGSAPVSRIQYAVTVGAVNGSSSFNGLTAAAGISGSSASHFYNWDEGGVTTYDGMNGGGPAYNAGTAGSAGYSSGYGGNGGNGNIWLINGQRYGAGAGGGFYPYGFSAYGGPVGGSAGTNGLGYGNFGSGGYAGGIILSYLASQAIWFGGTTTIVSGRVYHTFSSSGFLVPL